MSTTPSTASVSSSHVPRMRWHLEDIAYDHIDQLRIRDREDLFYMLASASFIETGSDTYTRNLVAHYAAYPEVAEWLQQHWEPEELQHGRALRRYVEAVWPEFDWPAAYDSFFAEYSRLCTTEELEGDRVLELAARCVVETGTTIYYQTIHALTDEPVLADLVTRIRTDEVQHYKYFFRYFRSLQTQSHRSRLQVGRVLWDRLQEMRNSDSDVALRHVWAHRPARFDQGPDDFPRISGRIYSLVSHSLPLDQAARMLLKPMALPPGVERMVERPLVWVSRRVLAA